MRTGTGIVSPCINTCFEEASDETKPNLSNNACFPVCNKYFLVCLIETYTECWLNKSNEFVVQIKALISNDETNSSAAYETSIMPLDLRPEERTVNLYNKIQWVDNTESSLKKCEVGQNKNNIYSGLEEVTAFAILL